MKPILFSTPMVQAILYGRKTMTRRVCNIPDGWEYNGWGRITSKHPKQGKLGIFIRKQDGDFVLSDIITAKYQVGDVLWVRETYGSQLRTRYGGSGYFTVYRADHKEDLHHEDYPKDMKGSKVKWKPSIYMPKEYARIFLRVTNVRVERLQDISEDDAQKEGVDPLFDFTDVCPETGNPCSDFKTPFQELWNSINGKGAWEANHYVFVYEFQRVEKPC